MEGTRLLHPVPYAIYTDSVTGLVTQVSDLNDGFYEVSPTTFSYGNATLHISLNGQLISTSPLALTSHCSQAQHVELPNGACREGGMYPSVDTIYALWTTGPFSIVAAEACTRCAIDHGKVSPSMPTSMCRLFAVAIPGGHCPARVALEVSDWRLLWPLSNSLERCAEATGHTPCMGGLPVDSANCAPVYTDSLCNTCMLPDPYLNDSRARCAECPGDASIGLFACCTALAVAICMLARGKSIKEHKMSQALRMAVSQLQGLHLVSKAKQARACSTM